MTTKSQSPRDLLLSAVTIVPEKQFPVTLPNGEIVLTLRGFRLLDDMRAMFAEIKALEKARLPVTLAKDDPSGEKSFVPTESEINQAAALAHIVADPQMTTAEWMLFCHKNNFLAERISSECLTLAGTQQITRKNDKGEDEPTFSGVQEAREGLERDPFPAEDAGGLPAASA